jgi:hypothetical protein
MSVDLRQFAVTGVGLGLELMAGQHRQDRLAAVAQTANGST